MMQGRRDQSQFSIQIDLYKKKKKLQFNMQKLSLLHLELKIFKM